MQLWSIIIKCKKLNNIQWIVIQKYINKYNESKIINQQITIDIIIK
jgi:hypothetical protein